MDKGQYKDGEWLYMGQTDGLCTYRVYNSEGWCYPPKGNDSCGNFNPGSICHNSSGSGASSLAKLVFYFVFCLLTLPFWGQEKK